MRWGLTSTEKGRVTSFSLVAAVLLMPPRVLLASSAAFAARAPPWLMWHLLGFAFQPGSHCCVGLVLPTCRTLHFLFNFMRFQPACCSSLSRSIWMAVKSFDLSATAPSFSPCTCESICRFSLGGFFSSDGWGFLLVVFLFVCVVLGCLLFGAFFCMHFWDDCKSQTAAGGKSVEIN